MPAPPIRSQISQALNVLLQLAPQVILERHGAQLRRQVVDLSVAQCADLGRLVHVEPGHQARADLRSDAVEGLEGAGDQPTFGEVDAEYEDLWGMRMGRIAYY